MQEMQEMQEDYKKLYQLLFVLMQEVDDISFNIENVREELMLHETIPMDKIDTMDVYFYNLLLHTLREMPSILWSTPEHQVIVTDIIREKLDDYGVMPTPYIKSKFYI
jgi:hypothetical protein